MACHKGLNFFRWSVIGMTSANLFLAFFISLRLWSLDYKVENFYVTDSMLRKELVDSAFAVGAGNWKFDKSTKLEIVDTKYTGYENILFVEFNDEKTLELPEAKFSEGIEQIDNKKLKFKIDGLLKMIYVKVKDVPICTNISIVEFKSLKN
jgi:hypothetical protein